MKRAILLLCTVLLNIQIHAMSTDRKTALQLLPDAIKNKHWDMVVMGIEYGTIGASDLLVYNDLNENSINSDTLFQALTRTIYIRQLNFEQQKKLVEGQSPFISKFFTFTSKYIAIDSPLNQQYTLTQHIKRMERALEALIGLNKINHSDELIRNAITATNIAPHHITQEEAQNGCRAVYAKALAQGNKHKQQVASGFTESIAHYIAFNEVDTAFVHTLNHEKKQEIAAEMRNWAKANPDGDNSYVFEASRNLDPNAKGLNSGYYSLISNNQAIAGVIIIGTIALSLYVYRRGTVEDDETAESEPEQTDVQSEDNKMASIPLQG